MYATNAFKDMISESQEAGTIPSSARTLASHPTWLGIWLPRRESMDIDPALDALACTELHPRFGVPKLSLAVHCVTLFFMASEQLIRQGRKFGELERQEAMLAALLYDVHRVFFDDSKLADIGAEAESHQSSIRDSSAALETSLRSHVFASAGISHPSGLALEIIRDCHGCVRAFGRSIYRQGAYGSQRDRPAASHPFYLMDNEKDRLQSARIFMREFEETQAVLKLRREDSAGAREQKGRKA